MKSNDNTINWFEIPVTDMERAKKFYQEIFGLDNLETTEMEGVSMTMLPYQGGSGKVSGALVKGDGFIPSSTGTLIYLNANPDLKEVEDRIEKAGGRIILPKTSIGEHGQMCYFTDTEGNRLGLHSDK